MQRKSRLKADDGLHECPGCKSRIVPYTTCKKCYTDPQDKIQSSLKVINSCVSDTSLALEKASEEISNLKNEEIEK